jgi:hypothetical protein
MQIKGRNLILLVGVAMVAILGLAYFTALPGLSTARQEPSKLETEVATWLLKNSVPATAVSAVRPRPIHEEMRDLPRL